jgi:uncharacterized protein (DUF2267 family)
VEPWVLWSGCDPLATPAPVGALVEVAQDLGGSAAALVLVGTAASRVLRRHVSAGEGDTVLNALPQHLRQLLGAEDR